ncbi:hypothetical protein IJT17_01045 [bacterium]|nr:hypothetical protein [bacterium]
MPLVPAKCTSCGDTVKVDSKKDAAICPSCGSAFIVEKAISNYNISIKADKIEINTDGITVSNLLQLASEEISSGNYAKTASYLARILERDTSNPLLRPVRIFCSDIAGATISSLTPAKLQEACRLVKETYGLLGEWKEQWGKRQYADIFSQAVFKAHLRLFNSFAEHNVTALRKKEAWASTSQHYLQCAKLMDEFISWGQSSGYYGNSSASKLPPDRQIQSWASGIVSCLQRVSLCYHDGMSLSQQQAQFCYNLADKYHQYCASNSIGKRLIPPYRGGEGIHSHRLTEGKKSDSVSDRRYFSQTILGGPSPEFQTSVSSCSASCATATIASVILLFFSFSLLDAGLKSKGSDSAATIFMFVAVLLPVAPFIAWHIYSDNENKSNRQKWINHLHQQWKHSPAQGTEAKALEFSSFVSSLEAKAQVRIKEIQ